MPTAEELEGLKVVDLQDLAAKEGIEGRSGMKKAELVAALAEVPEEVPAEALVLGSPLTVDEPEVPVDLTLSGRVSDLEARVDALQTKLDAVDERTIGSARILGS